MANETKTEKKAEKELKKIQDQKAICVKFERLTFSKPVRNGKPASRSPTSVRPRRKRNAAT